MAQYLAWSIQFQFHLQIEYKNGDKDSPCINPTLQEKNSENSPFNVTHAFSFEYIDFIKINRLPDIPHFNNLCHKI